MDSVQMEGLCPEAQRLQNGTPQPDRRLGQLEERQFKLLSGWSLGLGEGTHSYKLSGVTPAACSGLCSPAHARKHMQSAVLRAAGNCFYAG